MSPLDWTPIRVTLTAEEWITLTRSITGNGGHQQALREILRGLNYKDRSVTLNPSQLALARRCAKAYGSGGYQVRFKALLAAVDRVSAAIKGAR